MVELLQQEIPIFELNRDLIKIYPNEYEKQRERFEKLILEFKRLYGTSPDFIARSPGRVNLIGFIVIYN